MHGSQSASASERGVQRLSILEEAEEQDDGGYVEGTEAIPGDVGAISVGLWTRVGQQHREG